MTEQNTGWRDISTAPKDGTVVLVREKDGCVYSANFCPVEESWKLADQDGMRWNDDLELVAHWKALPPPPGEEDDLDKSRPVSSQAASREELAGKAAREAIARFYRCYGGFLYECRKKPHVIREYGREPTEIIFETDDSFECSNELQRIEDEFVGRAAIEAATEYRNQVIRELIEKAEDDGRTFQLSKPISECLDRRQRAQGAADWLKSQMEGE